ncbi:MAG: porin family protein [Methylococcales symbiont of Hymedesmia sp. n. MRB-2018]|nr:MAG: porin family protein [Methylococcales symbiont of Hymedesmia sp. n. MRB-2018]
MIKKTTKALGIATATLTLAGAMLSPQTQAGAMLSPQAVAPTQAERVANAVAKKTEALQAQVNQMATMMEAMQEELGRVKAATGAGTTTAKVQELDQWMASVKNAPMHRAVKDHKFSVRGGWMHMNDNRGSTATVAGTGFGKDFLTSEVDQDAFYYGGAIDFNMNNDLFGLMDGTSFGIELGIEYSELGDRETSGLEIVGGLAASDPPDPVTLKRVQKTVTVNMLRVSAAPKITFMHGSKLRPWIIPLGIDFNIISPPSDAVTVLNSGMQFGTGATYEVFDGIFAGVDGRYHWTPDDIDGVDTDGFTLGGSVGFAF